MIALTKKHIVSKDHQWWPVVIAGILSLLAFFILLTFYGVSFHETMQAMGMVFTDKNIFLSFLTRATPFILCGLVSAMSFRGGIYNLSAEGQFLAGMILSAWIIQNFSEHVGQWLLIIILIAAGAIGMVMGLVVGALRRQMGTHEILSSIFLVFVAHYSFAGFENNIDWTKSLTAIDDFLPNVFFNIFHYGIFYALFAALCFSLLYRYHVISFQIKLMGHGRQGIGETGQKEATIYWFIILTGGIIAGLAGAAALVDNWVGMRAGDASLAVPLWSLTMVVVVATAMGRMTPWGTTLASLLLALVATLLKNLEQKTIPIDGLFEIFCVLSLFCLLAIDFMNRYQLDFDTLLSRFRVNVMASEAADQKQQKTTKEKPKANKAK